MDQLGSTQKKMAWGVIVVLVIVLLVLVGMSLSESFSKKVLGLFEFFEDTGDFKDRHQQSLVASVPTDEQLKVVSNQKNNTQNTENEHHTEGMPKNISASQASFNSAPVSFGSERATKVSPQGGMGLSTSLLPKADVNSWNGVDTHALEAQDFLTPGQQFGTDTVASSNKNSSYDLRETVPIEMKVVSPWLQSSITPTLYRRGIA